MQETESIDEYILQHIDAESDYLKALYRDTHVKLLRPRMASGHLQGRMLKMFVEMIRPRHILEMPWSLFLIWALRSIWPSLTVINVNISIITRWF